MYASVRSPPTPSPTGRVFAQVQQTPLAVTSESPLEACHQVEPESEPEPERPCNDKVEVGEVEDGGTVGEAESLLPSSAAPQPPPPPSGPVEKYR